MPQRRASLPLSLSFSPLLAAAAKSAPRTCGNSQLAAGRKSDADAERGGSEEEKRQKRGQRKRKEREREKDREAGYRASQMDRPSRKIT